MTSFEEQVKLRYDERVVAIEKYVRDAKLPESYHPPALAVFEERMTALLPSFEAMETREWEPDVVFVSQGLTLDQQDQVYRGHRLPDGQLVEGTYRSFDAPMTEPTPEPPDVGLWDIAIVSTTDRPVLRNISKDGVHGTEAEKVIRVLAELPSVTDHSSAETIVAQASPREDVYLSMELSRLERGEAPVDSRSWVMTKHDIEVGGKSGAVYMAFVNIYRRMETLWYYRDAVATDLSGIRPAVSGKDLLMNNNLA